MGLGAAAGVGLAGGAELLEGFDSEGLDAVLAEGRADFGAAVFNGETGFFGPVLTALLPGVAVFAASLIGFLAGVGFLGAGFLTVGFALGFFLEAESEGLERGFFMADFGVGLFDFTLFDALLLTIQLLLC